jgi:acetolactate decarboxylase
LSDVVAHQREWRIDEARGSLVGFRFPDDAQGIDVAGYHLHFIADDRSTGGHVIDITAVDAVVHLDGSSDLHLEVPAGVRVGDGDTSALKGAVIRAVEGR